MYGFGGMPHLRSQASFNRNDIILFHLEAIPKLALGHAIILILYLLHISIYNVPNRIPHITMTVDIDPVLSRRTFVKENDVDWLSCG